MTHQSSGLGTLGRSIRSGSWLTLGMIVQKTFGVLTFLLLARLLTPADYGTIAAILLVTAVSDRLLSHGFEAAAAQRGGDSEVYLDAIWTLNIMKAIVLAGGMYVAAPWIAAFFNLTDSVFLLRISGLLLIIPSMGNVRQFYLFTGLQFKKIFWRDVVGQIAYTTVALVYALGVSATVWALFWGHIARVSATMVATYVLLPAWPRLSLQFRRLSELISYSKWIAGHNILEYIVSLLDQVFVGRLLGPEKLGFYSKANDMASLTTAPMVAIIRKVGFYAYNTVQTDLKKVQEGFIKSLHVIVLVGVPFSFLLIVEGGAIISVLLGQAWLSLVLPLKIVAVAHIMYAVAGLVHPLFNSMGKPEANVKIIFLRLLLSVPLLYIGIQWRGTVGAAMAIVVVAGGVLLYSVWLARPVLRFGWKRLSPAVLQISAALFPVAVLAIGVRPYIHSLGNDWIIVAWSALLALAYGVLVMATRSFFPGGPAETAVSVMQEILGAVRKK